MTNEARHDYRIETLWCTECDREIAIGHAACQLVADWGQNGAREVIGPMHQGCAVNARNRINEYDQHEFRNANAWGYCYECDELLAHRNHI